MVYALIPILPFLKDTFFFPDDLKCLETHANSRFDVVDHGYMPKCHRLMNTAEVTSKRVADRRWTADLGTTHTLKKALLWLEKTIRKEEPKLGNKLSLLKPRQSRA